MTLSGHIEMSAIGRSGGKADISHIVHSQSSALFIERRAAVVGHLLADVGYLGAHHEARSTKLASKGGEHGYSCRQSA
jgi:hypothetical protein